jgi:hypothetical protein
LSTLELYASQQVAQLSQLISDPDVALAIQEVTQLSNLNAAVALEVTQLSTVNSSLAQEVAELSTLVFATQQNGATLTQLNGSASTGVTQLSTVELYLNQEVGQLSTIITNTAITGIDYRPFHSQEITQLSNLNLAVALEVTQLSTLNVYNAQEITQLTSIDARLSTEVTQLSTNNLYQSQQVAQLSDIEIALTLDGVSTVAGVKGIIVAGVDETNTATFLQIDEAVGEDVAVVTNLDFRAYLSDEGKMFTANTEINFATTAETNAILIRNPSASTKRLFLSLIILDVITKGGQATWRLYKSPTVTAVGTTMTPVSTQIKASSPVSGMSMFFSPTTSALGTKIRNFSTGVNSNTFEENFQLSLILSPNTDMLLTAAVDANNRVTAITLEWVEAV